MLPKTTFCAVKKINNKCTCQLKLGKCQMQFFLSQKGWEYKAY